MRTFKQLTHRDRIMISRLRGCGVSLSQIAKKIGKNKATISREIRRNGRMVDHKSQVFWMGVQNLWNKDQIRAALKSERNQGAQHRNIVDWNAGAAQRARDVRLFYANQLRRRKSETTVQWVVERLKRGWSPEQIAGRSKGRLQISHEYIYRLIQGDRRRGGKLHHLLKRFNRRKRRLNPRLYRTKTLIPDRVGIDKRPKIVENRSRLGDLEADLVQGWRASGYVLTVVDRKSKYVILRKLRTKKMGEVSRELTRAVTKFGATHTLTLDNGMEFAAHKTTTAATGIKIYFAHPFCTTERATVENTNGLIRYYLPKKTYFSHLDQRHLNQIQRALNQRPRKCLNFLTPQEVHSKNTNASHRIVAFDR